MCMNSYWCWCWCAFVVGKCGGGYEWGDVTGRMLWNWDIGDTRRQDESVGAFRHWPSGSARRGETLAPSINRTSGRRRIRITRRRRGRRRRRRRRRNGKEWEEGEEGEKEKEKCFLSPRSERQSVDRRHDSFPTSLRRQFNVYHVKWSSDRFHLLNIDRGDASIPPGLHRNLQCASQKGRTSINE